MTRTKLDLRSLLLAPICGLLLSPAFAAEPEEVPAEDRERIAEMFESILPEHVKPSPVDGWYTIQKSSVVAYITTDGRYLLQGDLIDLEQQVNLTEANRTDARRDVMSAIADDQVITFSPAEVKYSVSIFTDVECTYCRRLHSQMDEYLAHGIEVRYLLYPRSGPASRSWITAEEVWCSADRASALTMAKLDKKFETSACDASIVQDHYVMGQEVGLTGTPAIIFEDGELLAGYLPPDALRLRLEQKAAQDQ
ncbi:MAG: DsbC family protein [Woeseiaceae bacterium]|nr:DsbC family protein [Woeseiaceae bacterium]